MNPYIPPGAIPFDQLDDGIPLYLAYYPPRPGERRRSMSSWNGANGETVAVTVAGQGYRRSRPWTNRAPGKWEKVKLP